MPTLRRVAVALAAVSLSLALVACGDPERLSSEEGAELAAARAGLDDAIDTEETLRTSPEEARRLRRRVQRIVSKGAFEAEPLDEFGRAALGELQQVVPSVVLVDGDGVPLELVRPALRDFQRYSGKDAARAMLWPATHEVERIERTVEDSGAGPDTEVPPPPGGEPSDLTVTQYLNEAERDVKPIWPELARRLAAVRDGL